MKDRHRTTAQIKIPEVRYNLKSHKDSKSPVLITAIFRYEGKKLEYTTKERVLPNYWNKSTRRCKESVNYIEGASINRSLDRIRNVIRETYRTKFAGVSVKRDEFKLELDYRLSRKRRPTPVSQDHKTLLDFIQFQIDSNKVRVKGKKSGQTWQKYKSMKERLVKFSNETGWVVDYKNIHETFKNDFILWLEDKGLSQNTIAKDIETLKSFLKKSQRYHNNTYYTDRDFRVSRIKTTKHYPKLSELKQLLEFDFSNEKHQKVVDLYLISAFGGGLRKSDVLKLSKKHEVIIEGYKCLRVYTYKGRDVKEDTEVVIPFTPELQMLIDKYDWNLPRFLEHQINPILKSAFAEAKLNRLKLIKSGVKGEAPVQRKLSDDIHFHTARYAYIDYMMNDMDISAEELRKITGQSLKTLLGYERGDKSKNAAKVASKLQKKMNPLRIIKDKSA